MIQLTTTPVGLAAIAASAGVTFTRFLTGSGSDENNHAVQVPCQDVPIAHSAIYLAGETYTINGVETPINYNSVKLVGVLEASRAETDYDWTELALMGRANGTHDEIAIAYGTVSQSVMHVTAGADTTFVINFEMVFDTAPEITVETSDTGVTWIDFLQHSNLNVNTGAHGLRFTDGELYVNDNPLELINKTDMRAICGISAVVSALPVPSTAWDNLQVYNRVDNQVHRLVKRRTLSVGNFIFQLDNAWQVGDGTDEGSLLVVTDDVTPSEGEIALSEAQPHFMAWEIVGSIDDRLIALEAGHRSISINSGTDDYNSEWISRMTGSGTSASPYLIYTPYDFNQIRTNLSACYRLENNLDFGPIIGITMEIAGGLIVRGATDDTAPMYNGGQGWLPITTAFSGLLDGNGKTIKGLISASAETKGMFNIVDGARLLNITLSDGFFINNSESVQDIGTFFGGSVGHGIMMQNCINNCTVIAENSANTNTIHIGGMFGQLYAGNGMAHTIRNCANHGRLLSYNSANIICGFGYFVTELNYGQTTVENCYNSAPITGQKACGFGWITADSTRIQLTNCYACGGVQGSDVSYAFCNDVSNAVITNCYAQQSGTQSGVVALKSVTDMEAAEFVDILNGELLEAVYTTDDIDLNNGLPIFIFERSRAEGIPGEMPLALLDTANRRLYSSKFSYYAMRNLANKQALNRLRASMPTKASCALAADGWDGTGPYLQRVSAAVVSGTSQLIAVPKSADFFSNGLTASPEAGQISFSAVSKPTTELAVDVLILN